MFRLALALGKTLAELRACLSYREFREWCWFYEIEPFGDQRADLRTGIVAATMKNSYAHGVPPEQLAKPADFMPFIERPDAPLLDAPPAQVDERQLSDEELAAWADAAIYGIPPGA